MKRLISVLAVGLFAAAVGFAQLQEIAQVNLYKTEPILLSQWRLEAQRLAWPELLQRLRRQPTIEEINNAIQAWTKDQKLQILHLMINNKLALQDAEHENISVTKNEIDTQEKRIRDDMKRSRGRDPTDAEFAAAVMQQTGQDVPAYRELLKMQMILAKYKEQKYGSRFRGLSVTDEEIRSYYVLLKPELIRPDTARVSMIRVPFTNAASKARAKETAERLAREIGSNPAKFDETSVRGAAPNSGYQADADYLPRTRQGMSRVGTEFLNTAFTLKQGEVSKLIEGRDGYYIIKVTETYELKILELDDIYQLGEPISVQEYIRRGLLQQKEMALEEQMVTELRKEKGNPPAPPYKILDNNLNW
jgi:parvulin-like peptidyl-prolyl isomerase